MRVRPVLAAAVLTVLPTLCLAQPQSAPKSPSAPATFIVGDPERAFDSRAARGTCLVVSFLPTIATPESAALIREYTDKAPSLAGVRFIFVSGDPAEKFTASLAALPGGDKLPVYRDADAKLSSQFNIPPAARPNPALILLDPAGTEKHRHLGKSPADRVSFAALSMHIAELTRDKETAEANLSSGLALQGYDPVAYLDEQKAVAGDKQFESSFRAVTYRFASAANRSKFNAQPEHYLPTYGGWCATAMAKGDKVEIDPKNFKVTSGRLFLFYKGLFGNAINDWNKDEPGETIKADANWKKLTDAK